MTYYNKIKKLDLESAAQMQEGNGPVDECLCSILAPPEDMKTGLRQSLKKAFRSVSPSNYKRNKTRPAADNSAVIIPLTNQKGGAGLYTTKETLKRKKNCGKCGCDKKDVVLNHSFANIKIITPDVSSICPCPNDCFPKDKISNVKVTVERLELQLDSTDSEASVGVGQPPVPEPEMKPRPAAELIESQYYGMTVERLEASIGVGQTPVLEPEMKPRPAAELIESQYYGSELEDNMNEEDTTSNWSFDSADKTVPT